jgi:cell cycle checkpoint protein
MSLSQEKKGAKSASQPAPQPQRATLTLDLTNLSDSESNSSFMSDFLAGLKPKQSKLVAVPVAAVPKSAGVKKDKEEEEVSVASSKKIKRSVSMTTAKSFSFSVPDAPVLLSAPATATDMLWIDKYAPASAETLAVHAKKVEAVRSWMAQTLAGLLQYGKGAAQKMLIVTGPPGSGKTATVRVVARELEVEVMEWINEAPQRQSDMDGWASLGFENQMTRFEDFLRRARHYPTLRMEGEAEGAKQKVILVEDTPYLAEDREQVERFRGLLRTFLNDSVFPLVFILCDSAEGTSSLDMVLGDVKMMGRRFEHVSFNATNATLVSKTLARICQAEGVVFQDEKQVYKQITEETRGDLRAAINALQMVCVGVKKEEAEESDAFKPRGRKKKPKLVKYLELGRRDASLSIFHGLGKVFHPKRNPETGKLLTSAEKISQKMPIDASLQMLFLHENYLSFFTNLDDCAIVLENLSLSDELLSSHFGGAMEAAATSVAIRGMIDPSFALANKTMIPLYRAKARDFEMIRASTRETADALFRPERVTNDSGALGDFGRMALHEVIPWIGKIVLARQGERAPDKALLPRLSNPQLQFVYAHCVFQPRSLWGSRLESGDGEVGEFRNAGMAAEAQNRALVAAASASGNAGDLGDEFDPVVDE